MTHQAPWCAGLLAGVGTLGLATRALASSPGDEVAVVDLNWATVSANAAVELKQTSTAPDVCHVAATAEAGEKELWSADVCLANKNQPRFVSNDGENVIVLDPIPRRGASWRDAKVAFLYHHTEVQQYAVAAAIVRDSTKIRQMAKHFYWLGGEFGVPGNPAKYNQDASGVDLEAIDGKPKTIRFDGTNFPQPPPAVKKKKKHKI
jgi:hypothetical protein